MSINSNTFEYNILFVMTLALLGIKLVFSIFIFLKILNKRKKKGVFEFDFYIAMFILLVNVFISRLLYIYFDFYLTKFDSEKYFLPQNVIYWKLGGAIYLTGAAILIFTIDRKILNFKYRGIFSYILFFAAIFELLYPINSSEAFEFVSLIEMIAAATGAFIFPIIFLYFGIKFPKLRNPTFLFAFGIIIYLIGGALVGANILNPLKAFLFIIWMFSLTLKIIGLILMTYGSIKFG